MPKKKSGSVEDFFKCFGHIFAWRSSWLCGQEHFLKSMSPGTPSQGGAKNLTLIGQAVSEKIVGKNGHIHVYMVPGQEQTAPWGQIFPPIKRIGDHIRLCH